MTKAVNVSVRWTGQKFDVEADLEESPMVFKAQMFALTGVQPQRQKIMFKGKTVSDDSWGVLGSLLKEGCQLMMMGSADAVPDAPKTKTVFLEDMTEAQLARAFDMPVGLKNLGNTCYLNATLQCLKTVPELTTALKAYRGNPMSALGVGGQSGSAQSITAAVRDVYDLMDKKTAVQTAEVIPLVMVQILHMVLPRFAEKDDHGHPQQQDANECWTEIMRMMQLKLPVGNAAFLPNEDVPADKSFVSRYFEVIQNVTMKCKEGNSDVAKASADGDGESSAGAGVDVAAVNDNAELDDVTSTKERLLQLSCYLSQEVKYLLSGLKSKQVEEITKRSPVLGRDAVYERRWEIGRLPAYLVVQINRFYYKEKDQVNAKILKDVKFQMTLDLYEMCSTELKKRLAPMRDRIKEQSDKEMEIAKKIKMGEIEASDVASKKRTKQPFSFPDDVGSNNSGHYELQAVLTHKGRSSNSGHYVAWVKQTKDKWLMCDDDEIHPVTTEDILRLSGGGDWHCAYLLLYGPAVLEEEDVKETNGTVAAAAAMEH